jgi:hypothetical protein
MQNLGFFPGDGFVLRVERREHMVRMILDTWRQRDRRALAILQRTLFDLDRTRLGFFDLRQGQ